MVYVRRLGVYFFPPESYYIHMKNNLICFGLRRKSDKTIVRFETSASCGPDGHDCAVDFKLTSFSSYPIWLVKTEQAAQFVRTHPGCRFSETFELPYHTFNNDELEVVEIELNVKN